MKFLIIKDAYLKLAVTQIFGIIISAANSMIDTAVTGRFLGADVVAAAGLFAPVVTLMGFSYVLVTGLQILCSRAVGSGESKKVVSLFSSGFIFLAVCGAVISVLCILFPEHLIAFLTGGGLTRGGHNTSVVLNLRDYISGYSYGITFQILYGFLIVFLPLNNSVNLSYISIAVMLVSNIVMDIAAVYFNLGAFGIGFATSASYVLAFLSVLHVFTDKYKAVHIKLGYLCLPSLGEAAILGLPSLMFTLGCTTKGYVMNMTLLKHIGASAVAVMNIQGNICAIAGAVPMGCAGAMMSLASMYYGENDRESLLMLVKYSLKFGVILSGTVMLFIMSGAYYISDFFFEPGQSAIDIFDISERMLLLFPSFLIFNAVYNIFIKSYQLQGKTRLVNIVSFAENIIMAVIAVILVPLMGDSGVWLSFPLSEIVCLIIIMLSVFIDAGRITFSLSDWIKLPENFGAKAGEFIEFSITSAKQVINISERVIDFCVRNKISRRKRNIAGLAVEEMAGNIVKHGFRENVENHANLRIVYTDEILTIRIHDNCPEFDPHKRLDQFSGEDPAANIGIRMIAGLADEMSYQNMAGININTVMIKISGK